MAINLQNATFFSQLAQKIAYGKTVLSSNPLKKLLEYI